MKKFLILGVFCFALYLLPTSTGCKDNSTESVVYDTSHSGVIFRKPNIYLYPTKTCSLSVKLEFPIGGKIIESIPDYTNGWDVIVEPSGKINNKYDFLFYESENPGRLQSSAGWVVNKDSLNSFFTQNLSATGFVGNEIKDFIDYWVPRLNDYPHYAIYPQYTQEIEKIIKLNISIKPDNVLRLFYVIKGVNSPSLEVKVPIIPKFERFGFTVAEWGVVL